MVPPQIDSFPRANPLFSKTAPPTLPQESYTYFLSRLSRQNRYRGTSSSGQDGTTEHGQLTANSCVQNVSGCSCSSIIITIFFFIFFVISSSKQQVGSKSNFITVLVVLERIYRWELLFLLSFGNLIGQAGHLHLRLPHFSTLRPEPKVSNRIGLIDPPYLTYRGLLHLSPLIRTDEDQLLLSVPSG